MKTLMIACSVVALAAAASIATPNKAEAFLLPGFYKLFGPVVGKQCHRVETHLSNPTNPAHVWICKQNSLPRWWTRNETDPIISDSDHGAVAPPVPTPPPPPPNTNCEQTNTCR